jgi:hypothetical protein
MSSRSRSLALALAAAVALLGAPAAAGAAEPANLLLTRDPGGARGSGFVVFDTWLEGDSSLLLLTAYHVVRGAKEISAVVRTCERGRSVDVPVGVVKDVRALVWPSHDLAAIRLADPGAAKPSPGSAYVVPDASVYARLRKGARSIAFSEPPPRGEIVLIDAVAPGLAECPSGAGIVFEVPALAAELERLESPSALAAKDALLLKYMSTGEPGASGGAVTSTGSASSVLGVHSGGLVDRNTSWAVSFAGQRAHLGAYKEVAFGSASWPAGLDPGPMAKAHANIPDSVRDIRSRYDPHAWSWLFVPGAVEGAMGRSGYTHGGYTPRLEAQSELLAWPARTRFGSLGVYGALGLRLVGAERVFLGPDGSPLRDSEPVEIRGYAAEVGPLLKARRLSRLRPALSLGGRVSLLPMGQDEPRFFLGAVTRARLAFSPLDGQNLALALEVSLGVDSFYDLRRTYTSVAARLAQSTDGRRAAWTAGLGLGVEWMP